MEPKEQPSHDEDGTVLYILLAVDSFDLSYSMDSRAESDWLNQQ